jgi:hypothetical protein
LLAAQADGKQGFGDEIKKFSKKLYKVKKGLHNAPPFNERDGWKA